MLNKINHFTCPKSINFLVAHVRFNIIPDFVLFEMDFIILFMTLFGLSSIIFLDFPLRLLKLVFCNIQAVEICVLF